MKRLTPVPSDLEIAQAAELKPILEIAESLGLSADDLEMYGKYKAKVHLDVREKFASIRRASTSTSPPSRRRRWAKARRPRPSA